MDLKIDLSGGKNADSIFKTGSNCLIATEVYINNCRKVELEDYVALSPRSMIYTHSFWQSILDGYSANFGPVLMKSKSWLGANSQILPNVIVGEGVIVMSGSIVSENIEAYVFAGGIPAKKIRQNIKKEYSNSQKYEKMITLIKGFLQYCNDNGLLYESIFDNNFVINYASKKYYLSVEWKYDEKNPLSSDYEHSIIILISGDSVKQNEKMTFFNLEKSEVIGENIPLVSELRNYLRRRGIIFSPFSWKFNFSIDSIQKNR